MGHSAAWNIYHHITKYYKWTKLKYFHSNSWSEEWLVYRVQKLWKAFAFWVLALTNSIKNNEGHVLPDILCKKKLLLCFYSIKRCKSAIKMLISRLCWKFWEVDTVESGLSDAGSSRAAFVRYFRSGVAINYILCSTRRYSGQIYTRIVLNSLSIG